MAEDTQPTIVIERTAKVPLKGLTYAQGNPRRGNLDAIQESLERNGQFRAIVVNRGTHTGRRDEILAGNHTARAARRIGWTHIAASFVDVDEEQATRIMLADNRTGDLGDYDTDALVKALEALPDLAGTGYEPLDLEKLASGPEKHTVTFEVEKRLDRKNVTTCPNCQHVFTPVTRVQD